MKPSNSDCFLNRWLTLALVSALSLLLAASPALAIAVKTVQAEIFPSKSSAVATTVELPYRWDSHFPGENGTVTYSVFLPSDTAWGGAPVIALFAPRLGNQAQIRLNGQIVHQAGSLDQAIFDASKAPLWVTIPTALLQGQRKNVTTNRIDIETSVQSLRWGGLSELSIAPVAELESSYWQAYLWQQTSYVVILIALILMGTLSGFIWIKQREGLYGLFTLSAFGGCLSAIDQFMFSAWAPWPIPGIVAAVALAWHVIFMSRFALGIAGRTQSWVKLSLLATMMAIGIAYVLAEPVYWTVAFAILCLPALAALIFTSANQDKANRDQTRWLFVVSLVVAMAALRDLVVVHVPESGMNHFAVLPHALFLFVLVMGGILARRYTEQHRLYQELNISLDHRVKAREQELQSSFGIIQAQSEQRVKLVERQRIMSDIHDGVGGQLVGLLNLIKRLRSPQQEFAQREFSQTLLEDHAQTALDELRVAVDAMQPVDGDLATVLATLRYRLEPRLKALNIVLRWQIEELPLMADLTPQKVLQIQKILLEAFTNIMRHSGANTVVVSAKPKLAQGSADTQCILLSIDDNGVGFDTDLLRSQGHGLGNMHFRARAIGAELSIARGLPQGTIVTLEIPI